jgi:hypothetical protein
LKKFTIYIVFLLLPFPLLAQITIPMIRANFGLDADLKNNFFNLNILGGNDDWFSDNFLNLGGGTYVIDTTGAGSIFSGYTSNPSTRLMSFARGMRFPVLSTINSRIHYDAAFVRDHRGTDSTSYAGGHKNGQSPQLWGTTTSPVPSKNDISEIFLHVRRDGTTTSDSLFFFGAVGIIGTTGDRYFDFELYQTDISFNKSTGLFSGYGPDYGHSTWRFNGSGQITQLGDVIFTAEYGTSGLTAIEARIWVEKTSLTTVNPQAFNWTGSFDGDGNNADYGYAGIVPKTGGNFYQGLQNSFSTWSGPFGNFTSGNLPVTIYDPVQYMEFSVNLSRLGLDPMTFTNGSLCDLAFGKVLVKTRTSTSFTSTISDFVSPFHFRSVADVNVTADFPIQCPTNTISTINVLNPLSTSTYHWSTPNGIIVGPTTGTSVTVDGIGTYIVTQELLSGCGENGRDTIVITAVSDCSILNSSLKSFNAQLKSAHTFLSWQLLNTEQVTSVTVERKTERSGFFAIASLTENIAANNNYTDSAVLNEGLYFYRLKIADRNGRIYYSEVIAVKTGKLNGLQLKVNPNPVTAGNMNLYITSSKNEMIDIQLIHTSGKKIEQQQNKLIKGTNHMQLTRKAGWQPGVYILRIQAGEETLQQKVIVAD